jgi:HK97 gp10 family phage protein
MASLKLYGGAELSAALRDLSSKVAGRLGTNAARAGARVFVRAAKENAPFVTGKLRDSIRVFDDIELNRSQQSQRAAGVGSRLFYAKFVEFGTAHSSAKQFLRPALDENAQDALDKVADNLSNGIERETAKYKGR